MGHLNQKDREYKDFLKNERNLEKIHKQIMAVPYTKLDKPVQHGWNKHYIIREDVLRSKTGPIKQACLDMVQRSVWSGDKSFTHLYNPYWGSIKDNHDVIEKSKNGLRIKLNPELHDIDTGTYDLLSEQMKKYFYPVTKLGWGNVEYTKYVFEILQHELASVITKSFMTHRRVLKPELEQEYDEYSRIQDNYIDKGVTKWRRHSISDGFRHKSDRTNWKSSASKIKNAYDPEDVAIKIPNSKKDWNW